MEPVESKRPDDSPSPREGNLGRRAAMKRIFAGLGGVALLGFMGAGCEDLPGYYYDSYGGYYSYSGWSSYYGSYMSWVTAPHDPGSYYGSYSSYGDGGSGSVTIEHPEGGGGHHHGHYH